MKPALLVIDVQKKFFGLSPTTAQSFNDDIEYINAAIEFLIPRKHQVRGKYQRPHLYGR
jgi:nicotinamidase-related amidase